MSIVIPQISLASAIPLVASVSTTEPSKTFTLSVYIDPQSVASYTAQANIKFPADLVSAESFTFNSAWMPLTQSGLDAMDNTSGSLIKTAGYPGGFSVKTLLGTATFKVNKAGTIAISVNKESYVLDVDSKNTLNTYGSVSVTSTAPVVVSTPPVIPTKVATTPATTKTTVVKSTTTSKTPVVTIPTVANTEVTTTTTPVETAPVAPVPKDKSVSRTLVLFVGAIIIAISAYLGFK